MSFYVSIVLWVVGVSGFVFGAVSFRVETDKIQNLYYILLGIGVMLMAQQMLNFFGGRKKSGQDDQESS